MQSACSYGFSCFGSNSETEGDLQLTQTDLAGQDDSEDDKWQEEQIPLDACFPQFQRGANYESGAAQVSEHSEQESQEASSQQIPTPGWIQGTALLCGSNLRPLKEAMPLTLDPNFHCWFFIPCTFTSSMSSFPTPDKIKP